MPSNRSRGHRPPTARPAAATKASDGRQPAPRDAAAVAVLVALLVVLAAARATAVFVPNMWLWGIDPLRFTAPFMGWGIWGLAALALLPAVSRRLEPVAMRISGSTRGAGWSMYVVWAAVAGLVVLLLPDRLLFVGDSLLRRDMLAAPPGGFRALNPQALLLDGWLHDALARRLVTGLGVGSEAVARALGVLEAMTMGALAVHLTRVLGLRGAAALAAAAVFLWSGALALFTGYAKSFSELALVTGAVGVFGLDAVRRSITSSEVGSVNVTSVPRPKITRFVSINVPALFNRS